jgi:FkbM family methyltransferase
MSKPRVVVLGRSLIGSALYRPARFVYQSLFDRAAISRRTARKGLYAQFIHPRDLVFDVGANIGNYSETFLSLGARVVAVDPDPRNLAILQRRFANRISIESCALGRKEGAAELHTCANDALSTLSKEWVKVWKADWKETTTVAVSTLDALKTKHGSPQHVKIDCEGYDYEVLCGMSFMPDSLSFEFYLGRLTIARSCLERLRGRKFNYSMGIDCVLQIDHWVDSDDMFTRLSGLPENGVGDVYSIAK